MDVVRQNYSKTEGGVRWGISIVCLLWSDGNQALPVDYAIYEGKDSKHELALKLLKRAHGRGFVPSFVTFDAWYASAELLQAIDHIGFTWVTRLKKNRLVSIGGKTLTRLEDAKPGGASRKASLKGYGPCRIVFVQRTDGEIYLATNQLNLKARRIISLYKKRWKIEEVFRALKQIFLLGDCQARRARAQKTHILASFKAFARAELRRLAFDESWYEQKKKLHRQATRGYLLANA